MALDADRIIDLAPAGQFGLIDRYLPDPYRRALSRDGDAMASLTRATREALRRCLSELEAVQRSRAVAFFDDLSDGRLLGALHDQSPWPEDDTESFRRRLIGVAALAMRGAATADRLLALAALAGNGTPLSTGAISQPIPPDTDYRFVIRKKDQDNLEQTEILEGRTDTGQTRQYFAKPGETGIFPVDVIDAPLRRHDADIMPLPGPYYRFALDNPASENLAGLEGTDPLRWPDPTFRITAGSKPFGPFALVQTGQAQVIVVNRIIKPGATLECDIRRMVWTHDIVAGTKRGALTCHGTKDSLYAGFGLSADDHLLPPPDADQPVGPLLTLQSKAALNFTGEAANGPPKVQADLNAATLDMPSFLGEGRSQWRIVSVRPQSVANPDIHAAHCTPVPSDADITLSARWFGRRPGEFAVVMPQTALAPDQGGPLRHRKLWLDQMIERFKLAGTVRIAQDMLFDPDNILVGLVEFIFRENLRLKDQMDLNDPLHLADKLDPIDKIEILTRVDIDGRSAAVPTDTIALSDTTLDLDLQSTIVRPRDGISFREGLPPEWRSAVRPRDTVEILPTRQIEARSGVVPTDAMTLTDAEARPPDLRSRTLPRDRMTLTEGLPDMLRSATRPTDSIAMLPTITLELQSSTEPQDAIGVSTDPIVNPDRRDGPARRTSTLTLNSVVTPGDRITIRRLNR